MCESSPKTRCHCSLDLNRVMFEFIWVQKHVGGESPFALRYVFAREGAQCARMSASVQKCQSGGEVRLSRRVHATPAQQVWRWVLLAWLHTRGETHISTNILTAWKLTFIYIFLHGCEGTCSSARKSNKRWNVMSSKIQNTMTFIAVMSEVCDLEKMFACIERQPGKAPSTLDATWEARQIRMRSSLL